MKFLIPGAIFLSVLFWIILKNPPVSLKNQLEYCYSNEQLHQFSYSMIRQGLNIKSYCNCLADYKEDFRKINKDKRASCLLNNSREGTINVCNKIMTEIKSSTGKGVDCECYYDKMLVPILTKSGMVYDLSESAGSPIDPKRKSVIKTEAKIIASDNECSI